MASRTTRPFRLTVYLYSPVLSSISKNTSTSAMSNTLGTLPSIASSTRTITAITYIRKLISNVTMNSFQDICIKASYVGSIFHVSCAAHPVCVLHVLVNLGGTPMTILTRQSVAAATVGLAATVRRTDSLSDSCPHRRPWSSSHLPNGKVLVSKHVIYVLFWILEKRARALQVIVLVNSSATCIRVHIQPCTRDW